MKVTFDTNAVLPKLTQVASAIGSKNQIPILSDICFTIKNGSMILTASDGETWITERADIMTSEEEDNTFCVSAQDIMKCLRSLSDEIVTMTLDEEKKQLTCDYGNGNISMPYDNADEYPRPVMNMEDASEYILPSKTLLNAIELTQTAIANDELRPIMNGIHFDFTDNKMTCNACNFLKMVKYCQTISGENTGRNYFTIPRKPSSLLVSVLSSLDEDVKVVFTDKSASFSNKLFKITARLLEGNYPDCDRIVPSTSPVVVDVESNVMIQALKHVLSVDNAGNLVVVTFKGNEITINAEDFNFGRSATETIKCTNNTEEEFSICFNGVVLTEMLKNIDDDSVVFEMSDPKRPAILYAKNNVPKEEYLSLIMPMVKNVNEMTQNQQ